MTVIVTGEAGFIGLNFIFHMLKAHLEGRIVCLDKLTYVGNLSTPKGEKNRPNFRFAKMDICGREAIYLRRNMMKRRMKTHMKSIAAI